MVNYETKNKPDEIELLAKIANRDEIAFRVIFDRYQKRIHSFLLKLLKSNELAEEGVQEVFLKVWTMGKSLTTISSLESYLIVIARNRAIDIIRANAQRSRLKTLNDLSWAEEHNETEEKILMRDARSLIEQSLESLPRQQRRVYELCHLEGLKYEEAAREMQISPLTVKSHMQQALRVLRQQLGPHIDLAVILILLKIF